MHTGAKIRAIRTLKGFSQENMANMVGLSRLAYGDIERGKSKIDDARLSQIAEKLGMSVQDIEDFDEKVNNFFDQCSGLVGINTEAV